MHTSQDQEPSGFLNLSPKLLDKLVFVPLFKLALLTLVFARPGRGVSQATHLLASDLFWSMQASQDQEPSGFLNLSPKPDVSVVAAGAKLSILRFGLTFILPGLAVLQQGQVDTVSALCTMQHGHSHEAFTGFKTFNCDVLEEFRDSFLVVENCLLKVFIVGSVDFDSLTIDDCELKLSLSKGLLNCRLLETMVLLLIKFFSSGCESKSYKREV